ncbi:phosphatidylinositol 4-phosphate 5-kinase-like protein 1 isoform 2-T6 [Salvelinus alpinus]|nr:phosphatidylinositol 4-phosphate 5-kinase-like protein 1 isoform X1 [Salvelinus alpinus]XP_023833905.1 phosphatidylinositol 4-phosphate 5-kinase-like protein 1 isoform X1 [Salvelinus alpinus]XP_023833906.1 phosphatidylinositol 4-phosphate 5-kinase-like protein 1 isoform X1 [Salvelinus alpinus]XP_023833907.1 phosphatidylinositol 4-phosphate 5-kinase-like protein 1 isoform X1 [Salvelinus alpinus]
MDKRSGLRLCHFGTARRRRWWGLRRRWIYIYITFTFTWRMLGVFKTNQEHDLCSLTCLMKEGLHAVLQTSNNTTVPDKLSAEHYKSAETQVHKDLEMQTFAGPVFAGLRRSLDITEEEYHRSLSSGGCYLQFISNSKSKADFFLTNDKRFFLKTQNTREVTFFLSNLKAYMDHLEKYPHSLVVRFLGLYSIQIPNKTKKYFIVMQNVFYPDERINTRYDIKGCEVGRWTDPASTGNPVTKILKDNNFEGKHIILDKQRSWLVDQVEIDSAFLRSLNVLDYSILLAHQPLHQDELDRKHSFSNLTMRTVKSMDQDSPAEEDPPTIPLLEGYSARLASDTIDSGSDHVQNTGEHSGHGIPLQEINLHSVNCTDADLLEFQAHHRRLLPNLKNSVHVIDGPKLRYFVGIVDFFTVYGVKKRQENLWKSLRFPGRAFSTVSPATYSQRFCQWVKDHTK